MQAIKLSETPLSTAKELFLQCKYLLNSSNKYLTNKQLKFINEIGIKLMEILDSLCSASDERRMLIKEINVLCDLTEELIKRNNESENLICQICLVQFITENALLDHVKQHSSQTSTLPQQKCVQCLDPFIFCSESSLCIDCTQNQVQDNSTKNIPTSPKRKIIKNKTLQM